jgi:phage protein D
MGIGAIADVLGGGGGGAADTGLPPATQRVIEIDGSELDEDVDDQIESVTVIDRLWMPDSFVLVFGDPEHDILAKAGLEIGAKVKISTTEPGADSSVALMSGEVTSIEAEYDLLGVRAVVRGYDLLHRLSAGRKTKTWDNVTYADVAKEIADAAGLDVEVDSSGGTLDHVIQGNVSDLDFLYQLGRKVGFDLAVDDDKLLFKKPTKSSAAPAAGDSDSAKAKQLVWSHNLLEFRARMSAVSQVTEVKVRGWDVDGKTAVIGQADAETESAEISMSPADLADAVGGETLVVVDRPVGDQGAADDLAKAIAEQVASAAYEATAVAVGSPELKAGVAVSIAEVDPALAGKWVITTARHEFGKSPYRTHLEFSGRQDRSLHGLVAGGLTVPMARTSIPGVVIGVVTDNDDPDEQGRVKVSYPWLGDEAESFWARLARPAAGEDYGFLWVPQTGEEVVVAFEQGDLAFPLVIGSLWNGKSKPPSTMMDGLIDNDGKVLRHGIVSPLGHKIMFYDADDDSGIMLTTEDKSVRIVLGQSDARMVIYCDGDVSIKSTGDLEMKADGALKIEATKGLDLKAGMNMTIKGAKVAIN